jgi:hypothetical protein
MSKVDLKLSAAWRKWAAWGLNYTLDIVKDRLLSGQMVRSRTGYLKEMVEKTSSVARDGKGFTVRSGTLIWPHGAFYGHILQVGAGPHTARAKKKKALRFFVNGEEIFRAHSGRTNPIIVSPRPFLDAAEPLVLPGLPLQLNKLSQEAVDDSFEDRRIQIGL